MELINAIDGTQMTIAIQGRLDTTTAPELSAQMDAIPAEITSLTLELVDLQYISSAGLRVILQLLKKMNKQGSMQVANANKVIMDVFELTGFSEMLQFI